jgi:hypothetical protein
VPDSSSIIEHINAMQKSGLASLAFFYCDFREEEKKDLRGLLSSLLVQLCYQSDSYCEILSKLLLGPQKSFATSRATTHLSNI